MSGRHRVALAVVGAVLAAAGSGCSDDGAAPDPDEPATTAAAFPSDSCQRSDLALLAEGLGLDGPGAPLESVRSSSGGELYSCGNLFRSSSRALRQLDVAVLVERFDDLEGADFRWADATRRSGDPASALGVARDPAAEVLTARPPAGSWDDAFAVAAVRTLPGFGPDRDVELDQLLVRAWARDGATVTDVELTYQLPSVAPPKETLATVQDLVDELLARSA